VRCDDGETANRLVVFLRAAWFSLVRKVRVTKLRSLCTDASVAMGSAVPALLKLYECGSTRVHHRDHWRPTLVASIADKENKVKTLVAHPESQSCLKLGSYDRRTKTHQNLSHDQAGHRTRRPELRAAADTSRFKSNRAVSHWRSWSGNLSAVSALGARPGQR